MSLGCCRHADFCCLWAPASGHATHLDILHLAALVVSRGWAHGRQGQENRRQHEEHPARHFACGVEAPAAP